MLIDGPYLCPFGIIIFPPQVVGVFHIRYVVGLASSFNASAKVDDHTVQEVASGDVLPRELRQIQADWKGHLHKVIHTHHHDLACSALDVLS